MPTESIYLRVDPKLDKDLRKLAARLDVSLTAICVALLGQGVDRFKEASTLDEVSS